MSSAKQEVVNLIARYNLHTDPKWEQFFEYIDFYNFNEATWQFYLLQAQEDIKTKIHTGNWLPRAPSSEEELYGHYGSPKGTIGALCDCPELKIGLLTPPSRHSLVAGGTGSGKSTTIRTIASEFDNLDETTHILYIDPKGDAVCFPERFHNFTVLNEINLKLSLNNPLNVTINKWVDISADIIAARCGMRLAKATFAGIIKFILGYLNTNNQGPIYFPSLNEILEAVNNKIISRQFASKIGYIDTLRQTLQTIIQESNGIFDSRKGFDINETFDRGINVVLDIRQFAKKTAMIVVDILIMQLLMRRQVDRTYAKQSHVLLIIDETDTVLDAQNTDLAFSGSMTPLELFFRLGREMNLQGCVGISSLANCTSTHIIGNMSYFICHRLSDAKAIYHTMQTLQLPKGCDILLSGLPDGRAIFKQSIPSWPRPFLVDIDYYPINKDYIPPLDMTVTEESVPDDSFYTIPGINDAIHDLAQKQKDNTQRDRAIASGNKLHEDAINTLKTACTMLYQPFLNVFKKLKFTNSGYQDKICQYLEEHSLVEFKELPLWRLPKRIGYPTSKGFSEAGIPEPNRKGRGSLAHRTLAHWIQRAYESQGKNTQIEYILPDTNHPVDVAVLDGNTMDVFEINITCDNLESHITQCFDKCHQVRSLTIVAMTKKDLSKFQKDLKHSLVFNAHKNKICFKTINELYPQEYQ